MVIGPGVDTDLTSISHIGSYSFSSTMELKIWIYGTLGCRLASHREAKNGARCSCLNSTTGLIVLGQFID